MSLMQVSGSKRLQSKIDQFSWYQTIDFEDGVSSSGYAWCGDPLWPSIKEYTGSLYGKRVLDLGSNAGIFCVRAALEGAECIGIEFDLWKPEDHYAEQADFVKGYFESKEGRTLPIKYLKGKMEDILDRDLSHFDWCFAIASIYYSSDMSHVIKRLYEICDNVLLRLRDESKIEMVCKLMNDVGFRLIATEKEDWSHLNSVSDEFHLFHYAR